MGDSRLEKPFLSWCIFLSCFTFSFPSKFLCFFFKQFFSICLVSKTFRQQTWVLKSLPHSEFFIIYLFWMGVFKVEKTENPFCAFQCPFLPSQKSVLEEEKIKYPFLLSFNLILVVSLSWCSTFAIYWVQALEVQGKHSEAVLELSKICVILRTFPPEESSVWCWFVDVTVHFSFMVLFYSK